MEPLGQFSAYTASYNRLSSATKGDGHLSTLPFENLRDIPTSSPQLLFQGASTPIPFTTAMILPATAVGSNSSLFSHNNTNTYQQKQTFNVISDCYNSSSSRVGATNICYENQINTINRPSQSTSISPNLGSQLQNAYGQVGPEVLALSSMSKFGVTSAQYDINLNSLGCLMNQQSNDSVYSNQDFNSQQSGIPINLPKSNFYSNFRNSTTFGIQNPVVNNNIHPIQQNSTKNSVPSSPAAFISSSSLPSPLQLSVASPSSKVDPVIPGTAPFLIQHQTNQTKHLNTSNFMNSDQPQLTSTKLHQLLDMPPESSNSPQVTAKEFHSDDFATILANSSNVPSSNTSNYSLFPHTAHKPVSHGSYQHSKNHPITFNETCKNYPDQIPDGLGDFSNQTSPLNFPIGGLQNRKRNICSSESSTDSGILDQCSHFKAGFDSKTPKLSFGHKDMSPLNGTDYMRPSRQNFNKERLENMGAYSPCHKSDQSSEDLTLSSSHEIHLQTQTSSPFPSYHTPVTRQSSASIPMAILPIPVDSKLKTEAKYSQSSQIKESSLGGFVDNFNTHISKSHILLSPSLNSETVIDQQPFWQDSNHNLEEGASICSEKRQSSSSVEFSERKSLKQSKPSDSSPPVHPQLSQELSRANIYSTSFMKSVQENVENNHQKMANRLPTIITNVSSKTPVTKVSDDGSNPLYDSSLMKLNSLSNQANPSKFSINDKYPYSHAQNPVGQLKTELSLLDVSTSELCMKSSQENSVKKTLVSNQYCDSPLQAETTIVDLGSASSKDQASSNQHLDGHSYLASHSSHETLIRQTEDSLNLDSNVDGLETDHENAIAKETERNVLFAQHVSSSLQPQLSNVNNANDSMHVSLFDEKASLIKHSPNSSSIQQSDQSLMVSVPSSSIQVHNKLVNQTHLVDNPKTPIKKLSTISTSIPTESSSNCSSTFEKRNSKPEIVVPSVEEEFNFLSDPGAACLRLEQEQKPKSTKRGRPPKNKDFQFKKMPEKKVLSFPPAVNNGFMASYIKFLQDIQYRTPENVVPPPRREQSTRKAKEKSSIKRMMLDEYEDADEFNSIHSDSDPAWSPAAMKDDSDEDFDNRRRTRTRSVRGSGSGSGSGQRGRKRGRPSTVSEISSDDEDDRRTSKHKKYSTRTSSGKSSTYAEDKSDDSDVVITDSTTEAQSSNKDEPATFPFHVGDYVMSKNDVEIKYPPIWRVDGKSLLQKFETFEQKGEIFYKNIPTYAGWTPQNRDNFQKVSVKVKLQSRNETIVQLLKKNETKLSEEEQKEIDKFMEESIKYQDNFEIYIQTLISQALDSNFLAEIIQEKDEYFLENVKVIDDITTLRRQRLINGVNWQDSIVEKSMATWPCFDVLQGLPKEDVENKMCSSCKVNPATKRVIAYGQPYNNENLEGCAPDPAVSDHKDFLLCKKCINIVTLYNKIVHQKYLMFIQCANKVQEERTNDPTKDTTVILNELLADEEWLSQLFKDVRTNWAQVEKLVMENKTLEA